MNHQSYSGLVKTSRSAKTATGGLANCHYNFMHKAKKTKKLKTLCLE